MPKQGLNPGWGDLQEEKKRQSYSEWYKKPVSQMKMKMKEQWIYVR